MAGAFAEDSARSAASLLTLIFRRDWRRHAGFRRAAADRAGISAFLLDDTRRALRSPTTRQLRMTSTDTGDELQPECEAEGQSLDFVQRLLVSFLVPGLVSMVSVVLSGYVVSTARVQ